MDFALSHDQRMMQASIAGVLDRASPLERVRAFAGGREAVARDVWAALVEIGAAGMLISEHHGGLGLGLLDAALAAEALGSRVAPSPFLGSAILAPIALTLAGTGAQQDAWLPKLATGEVIAGAALHEAIGGARDAAGVSVDGIRLTGHALFALDTPGADILLVADRAGGLHLVGLDSKGVEVSATSTIDGTRRFGEVKFANAAAEPLVRGSGVLPRLRDAAFVILAADMLGAAQAMLDKAVAYAAERRQFGRPIGSFQAVKHMCAEMAAELEPCRALVWYAAYAFDAVPARRSS